MGVIDRAILQSEITQALNALFANGQVGRTEAQAVLYENHAPDVSGDGMTGWTEETGEYTTDFTIGQKYVVCLDSGTYETECRQGTEDGFNVYLGNGKLLNMIGLGGDYPDTGESFVVIIEMGVDRIAILDTNGGQSVVIKTLETIHPIDQKFIPGAVLPVVELTTVPTVEGAALTEEESAQMDEIVTMGMPIVLKLQHGGAVITTLLSRLLASDSTLFSSYILLEGTALKIMIAKDDNWTIALVPQ